MNFFQRFIDFIALPEKAELTAEEKQQLAEEKEFLEFCRKEDERLESGLYTVEEALYVIEDWITHIDTVTDNGTEFYRFDGPNGVEVYSGEGVIDMANEVRIRGWLSTAPAPGQSGARDAFGVGVVGFCM